MSYPMDLPPKDAVRTDTAQAPRPARFAGSGAKSYDARIRRLVPGYATLLDVIAPVLAAQIGRGEASILISGAGTGAELSELAFQSTHWRFTAVDPSEDMLAIAGRRADMLGCLEQVDFHACALAGYSCRQPHDAGLSILVSHFLPDDGEKAQYFKDMSACLKPGAPLVFADLGRLWETPDRPAYSRWVESVSPDPSAASATVERIARDFHPVDEARLARLLNDAEFSPPQRIFQAMDFAGYLTIRR